jgi:dTDP-4-amino-4,6-dideoxygalactose transaminase
MIPYGRQSINRGDVKAVVKALKSDWLTTGPLVGKFEDALSELVGAPAITVSSGTAALHCAYSAIDLKPGDEVITPPITFVATQAAASMFGAKIVFADVQKDSANIDPSSVEKVITKNTKAIVAVDYAGHPAELDELKTIAKRYGAYLIEDAAHSLGSVYKGKPVGSIADITTFSFFPTKNITTGEGGAVSSPIPHLLEKAKKFARQGLERDEKNFKLFADGPWHQEVHEFGLNYRLPDILCALGISQLKRIQEFKSKRQLIFDYYTKKLASFDWVKLPTQKEYSSVNWHLFPIQVPKEKRLEIVRNFHENEIKVQVNYFPVHLHPKFRQLGFKEGDFPISENFYHCEISLPMYSDLTEKNLKKVIKTLELCNP